MKGAGPGKTKIKGVPAGVKARELIRLGNTNTLIGKSRNIVSGLKKGSSLITVDDASNISIGDFILIDQFNDPSITTKYGKDTDPCTWCSREKGARALGQMVSVTGKEGNKITVDPSLYYDFNPKYTPQVTPLYNMHRNTGLEDLFIERSEFTGHDNEGDTIKMWYCSNCWVKNIESYRSALGDHIELQCAFRSEIRDSYFHHGWSYDGGHAYGVNLMLGSSDNLIENNIFEHLRHSMVVQGAVTGNVFGYNYSVNPYGYTGTSPDHWLYPDISSHGAHPMMTLWEGNIAAGVALDYVHGSSSHHTFLRNHITRESTPEKDPVFKSLNCVIVQKYNRYTNFVGNIFGKPGQTWTAYEDNGKRNPEGDKYVFTWGYKYASDKTAGDPLSKRTALRYGNYDYATNSVKWDSIYDDQSLPDSYYLKSKPSFFGDLPWPSIGPDLIPMVSTPPARDRYNAIKSGFSPR